MNERAGENSLQVAYECYERRMSLAVANMPSRLPWKGEGKAEIRRILRHCLGMKEGWKPAIEATLVRCLPQDGFSIEFLAFRSWEAVYGGAHLYVPDSAATPGEPLPFIFLACGHGGDGKLSGGYQAAARRLARQGAYVLVPDLIGQGERSGMGHANAVHPFACGTSVQGLIALEALAWLDWAQADTRFDRTRLAAMGNSGGGLLTCLLAALSDDLAAISSSGYPSTFEFIARKEKKHCHCNILPGIVGQLEMWQLYGLFAPKPLFLFQVRKDSLFPEDLFFHCVRKVRHAYEQQNAGQHLRYASFAAGEHSWDTARRFELGAFMAKHLRLAPPEAMEDDTLDCLDTSHHCRTAPPQDAIDINELAMRLSGTKQRGDLRLWDVYPPRFGAASLDDACLDEPALRGTHRQILAQFEAFSGGDP